MVSSTEIMAGKKFELYNEDSQVKNICCIGAGYVVRKSVPELG